MFGDSPQEVLAAHARRGHGSANLSTLSDRELRLIEAGHAADFIMATNDADQQAMLAASAAMTPVSAELRRRRAPSTLGPLLGQDGEPAQVPAVPPTREQLRAGFKRLARRRIKVPAVTAAASAVRPGGSGRRVQPAPAVVSPGTMGIEVPGWADMVPAAPIDPATGRPVKRSAEEQARLIAAAQAEHDAWRARGDAQRLAAGRVPTAEIVWAPFTWLAQAVEQAPADCPAWPITTWSNALIGPGRIIGPVIPDEQLTFARLTHHVDDWATAWHLCVELAGHRHNAMPNPRLAQRATFRSPETAWTALQGAGDPLTSNGLLAALWELLGDRHDPSARIVKNQLVGDHPCTRLAACLVGPVARDRTLPERANVDSRLHGYGPGSVMQAVAERLHGGPLPPDTTVLDSLTDDQRRALAGLVTQEA
jgi:hypothetical protein